MRKKNTVEQEQRNKAVAELLYLMPDQYPYNLVRLVVYAENPELAKKYGRVLKNHQHIDNAFKELVAHGMIVYEWQKGDRYGNSKRARLTPKGINWLLSKHLY